MGRGLAQGLRRIQEGRTVQGRPSALGRHGQGQGRDHPQHQRPEECGGGRRAVHPRDVAKRQHERRPRPLLRRRHQRMAEPERGRSGLARGRWPEGHGRQRDDALHRDHHGRHGQQGRPQGRGERRAAGGTAAEEARPERERAVHAQPLDGPPGLHRAGREEELPAVHPASLGAVQAEGRREARGAERRCDHHGDGQDGDHGQGQGERAADGAVRPIQERGAAAPGVLAGAAGAVLPRRG